MDMSLLLMLFGILGSWTTIHAEFNSTLYSHEFTEQVPLNLINQSIDGKLNGTTNEIPTGLHADSVNISSWNGTESNRTTPCSTDKENTSTANVSTEKLLEKMLDGYKQLLSKTYWEQRMKDPYFLGEVLVPFTAGIAVSWLLVLFVCTVKICCCSGSKRRLRKTKKIRTIKNDHKNKDGTQWMLLERNSSDEEI